MPESYDTGSAFLIRELTGQRRTVKLVDRALPYRPYELETEQNLEISWYPGNPIGAPTVLGAREGQSSIRGAWKDKYLGRSAGSGKNEVWALTVDGSRIETASAAAAVINSIVREGQQVEVIWDDKVRIGFLRKFRESWDNRHDLSWEMTFEWVSRGEDPGPAVFQQAATLSDTSSLIEKKTRDLLAFSTPPFPTSLAFQTRLADLVTPIVTSARTIVGAVNNLANQSISPQEGIRNGVAVCNALILQAGALRGELQSEVPGMRNTLITIGEQTFGERLSTFTWARRLINSAVQLRRLGAERRVTLAKSIGQYLLGTYISREGDDLRTVSQLFYKTPYEWRRLLNFNQLSSSLLEPNQLILVPRIDIGDRRN